MARHRLLHHWRVQSQEVLGSSGGNQFAEPGQGRGARHPGHAEATCLDTARDSFIRAEGPRALKG